MATDLVRQDLAGHSRTTQVYHGFALSLEAERGVGEAQFWLGVAYDNGEGMPEDYVKAYAWLNLAGAQGEEADRMAKDSLRKRMTREQIARSSPVSCLSSSSARNRSSLTYSQTTPYSSDDYS